MEEPQEEYVYVCQFKTNGESGISIFNNADAAIELQNGVQKCKGKCQLNKAMVLSNAREILQSLDPEN